MVTILKCVEVLNHCCVLETNTVLLAIYVSKTEAHKKRTDLWLLEAGVGGGGQDWMKVIKKYKLAALR